LADLESSIDSFIIKTYNRSLTAFMS